ncbi:response regulator [Pseudomonas sp. NPDC087697]|uniref:response regulator n=1 Tax=Pseudomonas sp. NPDC087697 TaxID=3364447 RepID=UPI00382B464A
MEKIRIVLADDHPIVLMGVTEFIERDERYSIVAQAQTSSELVELLRCEKPDIVITDYNMPGDDIYGDGVKLIEYLIRHFPEVKLLVLTMLSNKLILSRLYDLGVGGVVLKNGDLKELPLALDSLAKGNRYHGQVLQVTDSVVKAPLESMEERIASLSVKEFEVLRLFASGMSVRDIAQAQNRSVKTVSTQKITSMRKLKVDNDHALLTFCIGMNLI